MILEQWSIGVLECRDFGLDPITPVLQYSNTPVSMQL